MIPTAFVFTLIWMLHVLCAEMATGTTMAKTTMIGTSANNELYNAPPPVPRPRQNLGIPTTSNVTTENISDPQKPMDIEQPQNDGRTSPQKGESRRSDHETVGAGHCLYYTDPLQCWAQLQSRGLNWLRLAREYNSSFDYDFPDTCRYTSTSFRCTIPLPGHLATILHTLSFYDLWYQIKMADRGPYGLHLDFLMNLNDVVTLMDLFSAESALNFQQQVWDFEESIYHALKTEVYGLPKVPYDRRDLRPTFYAFFVRICNQLDMPEHDGRLQRISILKRRRPMTSLDDYLNDAHTRQISGIPSAIHILPTSVPRAQGKQSTRDSRPPPSSGDSKTQEPGYIYMEADSAAEYLLLTPLNAPVSPHDPSRGIPSSSGQPLAIPQLKPKPHGYKPTKNIFARWIEKKTQMSKNLGTV